MRLTLEQVQFIKATVERYFGPGARVWLFGSRLDDAKRGGDVDFYVEPCKPGAWFQRRLLCLVELKEGLPYPIDLVVAEPGLPRAVDRIARAEGVRL
ncbi:MAG: nucleotidyltransferase domain-containing protein [Burkholderiales bacterium]|nr:nucleotidyltransferase domain-containing protein [Burkholderiales bacterium]